jgi:hypothetical protein
VVTRHIAPFGNEIANPRPKQQQRPALGTARQLSLQSTAYNAPGRHCWGKIGDSSVRWSMAIIIIPRRRGGKEECDGKVNGRKNGKVSDPSQIAWGFLVSLAFLIFGHSRKREHAGMTNGAVPT